ncbi:YdcF family protein [Pseudoalteromonas luteoviolacea]|uniref:YdcF family protein n=1 Tax=Pseudoalteromonas luteoviolacea TaxID=43657 RepID=UPI00115159FB|nr:YdcF family protein [Pseudoalteromonas luteoviolacea]TQF67635.1 YdcF family protein [Pseudoalteromonas luteoviolacea]
MCSSLLWLCNGDKTTISNESPSIVAHLVIILGNKNDKFGNLSPISKSRCQLGFNLFKNTPSSNILCTGGFGKNFNQSPNSHGSIAREYLMNIGAPSTAFLNEALSRFTIEDATLTAPIIEACGAKSVDIVSSDFHIERVKLIFEYIQPSLQKQFHVVSTRLPENELARLYAHEAVAIKRDAHSLHQHFSPIIQSDKNIP